jgi:Domain of unknown function (DUF5664)
MEKTERTFPSGARKSSDAGKGRPDLIPYRSLRRLALHYQAGAEKYGERNWEKGMPVAELCAALLRHFYAYANGDKSEDHLAAVLFNAMALMHFEEEYAAELISQGRSRADEDANRPRPARV